MDLQHAIILTLGALPAVFLAGMLALWTLTSRGRWFWRALPIVGWLMLTGLAAAPGLWLLFTAEIATIAVLVTARRGIVHRAARRSAAQMGEVHAASPGWQFSLGDALLAVLLTALCVATLPGLRGRPGENLWPNLSACLLWILAGAISGCAVSLAAWAAFGSAASARTQCKASSSRCARLLLVLRSGLRYVAALLIVGGLGIALAAACDRPGLNSWANPMPIPPQLELPGVTVLLVIALWLMLAVWLRVWRLGGRRSSRDGLSVQPGDQIASRPLRRWQIALRVILAAPLLLAALLMSELWWELVRVVPIRPDAPGAEQAVRLEAIAGQIDWSGIANQDPDAATSAQRALFATVNAGRLSDIHNILAGPCAMRLNYADFDIDLTSIQSVREMSRAFDVQSRAAAADGDYGTAAIAGLDSFRLGSRGQRGGVIVNKLVAVAIEQVGVRVLVDAAPGLDRSQWRRLDAELAAEERDRESLDDVFRREYAWTVTAYGWLGRVDHFVEESFRGSTPEPFRRMLEDSEARTLAQLRLLRTALAIRFYRQDEGHFPPSLAALVPNWLDAIPRDPFGDQPLVYRADDEGYRLYSIGPNRVDDGGQMVSLPDVANEGDLFLEIFDLESTWEAELRVAAAKAAEEVREQAELDAEP